MGKSHSETVKLEGERQRWQAEVGRALAGIGCGRDCMPCRRQGRVLERDLWSQSQDWAFDRLLALES